jgi:hypothetical protein
LAQTTTTAHSDRTAVHDSWLNKTSAHIGSGTLAPFSLSTFFTPRRNQQDENTDGRTASKPEVTASSRRQRHREPLPLLLSRSSLLCTEQVSTGSRRASVAASPLSIARAHLWVDAPTLSGITVWLTGSASFSAVEGLSPSSSRTTVAAWASTRNSGDLCLQPLVASSRTVAVILDRLLPARRRRSVAGGGHQAAAQRSCLLFLVPNVHEEGGSGMPVMW